MENKVSDYHCDTRFEVTEIPVVENITVIWCLAFRKSQDGCRPGIEFFTVNIQSYNEN